ncbi:hypothetical protein CBM2609_B40046 [Cupriavidus taiwanensis]|uniref:Uncharacterized protein n=1 Tax=Cupriavidus taiwanensis TaxID=164546 RepID=A0A375EB70_9BURK|nr:hypothetical protein CBM2604_B50045 [Cupriavidus taiwanensis]SOZ32863.1 hypothetical protein CBM2609_B40046 [Cupriavidus taiwanensis]SOZ48285.1 hypothetical protein CBM2610_B40045 [Cupriavidus taiwanensis]SOZ69937.1 hypothetical protein CBM2614_B80086 [Cupriavidus taiwanensis]SOZ71092.1 hypothetical protein CBM2615_B80087 [Cupriavidus taiwanensis]
MKDGYVRSIAEAAKVQAAVKYW